MALWTVSSYYEHFTCSYEHFTYRYVCFTSSYVLFTIMILWASRVLHQTLLRAGRFLRLDQVISWPRSFPSGLVEGAIVEIVDITFFFFSISLTVGASRLMGAYGRLMDLLRLLFGVGFQIIYNNASNLCSLVNMLRTCEANCYYSLRCI